MLLKPSSDRYFKMPDYSVELSRTYLKYHHVKGMVIIHVKKPVKTEYVATASVIFCFSQNELWIYETKNQAHKFS